MCLIIACNATAVHVLIVQPWADMEEEEEIHYIHTASKGL